MHSARCLHILSSGSQAPAEDPHLEAERRVGHRCGRVGFSSDFFDLGSFAKDLKNRRAMYRNTVRHGLGEGQIPSHGHRG